MTTKMKLRTGILILSIFLVSAAFVSTASAYSSVEHWGDDLDIMYRGSSQMTLSSYFHGIRTDYITNQVFVGDGTTEAQWWGSSPANADKITLTSTVTFSGMYISISLPAGAGFSSSGSSAVYTGTWYNEDEVTHIYQNLEAQGLNIYDEDQYDSATFRFSNTDYTLNTHIDLDA